MMLNHHLSAGLVHSLRRRRWGAGAIVVVLLTLSVLPASSQTRRGVVVGINQYAPTESATGFALRKWKDLDGAVNDAESMAALLDQRFEFDEVTLLLEGEATREAILAALVELESVSNAGDVAVFYYAGHGSQVRNTGSSEADGLDETIVPSDVPDGAEDIRDKELRAYFNRILDKGALLTLIFDSCHSGSITRGLPGTATRFLEPSDRVIDDPSEPPRPVDRGALVFSSAQDNQLASEMLDDMDVPRGAFTWALNRALLEMDGDAPASEVFLKARALMKGRGMAQDPVLGGLADRRSSPLFGGVSESTGQSILVLGTEDGAVHLQAGLATGLRPGSQLQDASGNSFVVTVAAGPATSWAEPVGHSTLPSVGEALTVTKWVAAGNHPVRFHIPATTLTYNQLVELGEQVATQNPVEDPTEASPDHVVFHTASWQLLDSQGTVSDLGMAPDWNAVSDAGNVLHVEIPAFQVLKDQVTRDLATMGLDALLTDDRTAADYVLTGRFQGRSLRYAWVQREATAGSDASPAPPRTDFLAIPEDPATASTILARDVKRLHVIYGWLGLNSPPDNGAFPYSIRGFEHVDSGEVFAPSDTLRIGERYRIVLSASMQAIQEAQMQATINNVMQRYLYVFALDRDGNGSLLWPSQQEGSVENDINFFTFLPEQMPLPANGHLFTVAPPAGMDSFFLLSSEEPLPDPGILSFSGVRTRAEPEGPQSELSQLLFGLGEGTRGEPRAVPLNWSIERVGVFTAQNP